MGAWTAGACAETGGCAGTAGGGGAAGPGGLGLGAGGAPAVRPAPHPVQNFVFGFSTALPHDVQKRLVGCWTSFLSAPQRVQNRAGVLGRGWPQDVQKDALIFWSSLRSPNAFTRRIREGLDGR